MSLTTTQLDVLQADLNDLKGAVTADATAQAALVADAAGIAFAQAQLATDTASGATLAAAVTTAEQKLLADAQADFAG